MINPRTFEMFIITPKDLNGLYEAATKRNDDTARKTFSVVMQSLEEIRRRKPLKRMQCMCVDCTEKFRPGHMPRAFAVMFPMFDEDPEIEEGFTSAICEKCYDADDFEDRLLAAYAKLFGPVVIENKTMQ